MKIVHTNELPWADAMNHGRFAARRKGLAGDKLACGIWELLPGKRSAPMHMHHVTEEAMYVLSGLAKVRTPEGETAIGPGDWVSFPAADVAHHIVNDGTEPFLYLALAAGQGFDMVEYPESGKLATAVGKFPTGKRFIFRQKEVVTDYFEGEE